MGLLSQISHSFYSSLRNKNIIAVISFNFFAALATGLTITLIPLLISDFTPSFTFLGVTTSLSALSSMFFMPLTSYLSDIKYSRKTILVILLVVHCLASSLLLFVSDVFLASAYFLLVGLVGGYLPISKALVIENTNMEEITTGIGTLLGLRNLARLFLGPFFAGFLVIFSFFAPFYVGVSFALAGLIVALVMIKEPRGTTLEKASTPAEASISVKTLFSNKVFLACSLIYVEMGIWHNWFMIYLVLYANRILHYSTSFICFVFSLGGLIVVLSQISAGLAERLVGREKLVIICSFLGGLIPVLISFSFTPFMFIAILLGWCFLSALKDPSLSALAGSCLSSLKATSLSLLFVMMNISIFFGAIIEGIIWDLSGGTMLNLAVTVLSLVAVIPAALLILVRNR